MVIRSAGARVPGPPRRIICRAVGSLVSAAALLASAACSPEGPSLVATDESDGVPTAAEFAPPAPDDITDGTSGTTVRTDDGCAAAAVGDDDGTARTIDLDGDELPDELRVHRDAQDRWRIRLRVGSGDEIDAPLQVDLATAAVAGVIGPVGAMDLDGDGSAELFSVVGEAPDTALVTMHTRQECALAPLTIGGAALSFPVGVGPLLISGLACSDHDGDGRIDGITGWIGQPDETNAAAVVTTFRLDGVAYRLDGAVLEQVGVSTITLESADAAEYGRLDCPDVAIAR